MDTLFPEIIVEKYTVSMWRYPSGWWVTIRAYTGDDGSQPAGRQSFQIPIERLKVEDFLHLIADVYEFAGSSTP